MKILNDLKYRFLIYSFEIIFVVIRNITSHSFKEGMILVLQIDFRIIFSRVVYLNKLLKQCAVERLEKQ